MSLSAQLREVQSKPNDSKFAQYEAIANRVVATNDSAQVLELVKHCQCMHHLPAQHAAAHWLTVAGSMCGVQW